MDTKLKNMDPYLCPAEQVVTEKRQSQILAQIDWFDQAVKDTLPGPKE